MPCHTLSIGHNSLLAAAKLMRADTTSLNSFTSLYFLLLPMVLTWVPLPALERCSLMSLASARKFFFDQNLQGR